MTTLTITTTSAQDARIATAYGTILRLRDPDDGRLPRDATKAEVKAAIIAEIVLNVLLQEQLVHQRAAEDAIVEITPT